MTKFWKNVNDAYKAKTNIDLGATMGTGKYDKETESKYLFGTPKADGTREKDGLVDLAKAMAKGDPQVAGQLERGMKLNFENTDFGKNAFNDASKAAQQSQDVVLAAKHFLSQPNISPEDRKKATDMLKQAQEDYVQHVKEMNSPNAANQKQREEEDYMNNIIASNMQGYAYHNTKSLKMNESYKMMRELNDKIAAHQADKEFDLVAEGAMMDKKDPITGLTEEEQKAGVKPHGLSLQDKQDAIANKHKSDLEIAQAKSDIVENRQMDLIDYKDNPTTAAKAWSVLKNSGEKDFVSIIPSLKSGNWDDNGDAETISTIKGQTYRKELAKKLGVPSDAPLDDVKITQDPKDKTKLDVEFDTGWGSPNYVRNIHKTISADDFVNFITDKELGKLGYEVSGTNSTGSTTAAPTVNYTPEEFTQATQYAKDSLGLTNPSKEDVEKILTQAKQ